MTGLEQAVGMANLAIALSIVALTLSTQRVRRRPIAARSWLFFGLAASTLLLHATFDILGADFALLSRAMGLLTSAALGVGLVLLYGIDREGLAVVERHAAEDALTGLLNIRSFNAAANERLRRTVEHRGQCALVILDVDGFKKVNDQQGHQAGDKILKAVADAIRANLRTADIAGRYGGDEFVVLLDRCDAATARTIAQRIRWAVELLSSAAGGRVSLSAGIAICPKDPIDVRELTAVADAKLLEVKRGGKNGVRLQTA